MRELPRRYCCTRRLDKEDQIGGSTTSDFWADSIEFMSLFQTLQPDEESQAGRPLADRMRPRTLDQFIGQEDLLGPGKPLRPQIEREDLGSMLLSGPPGCGKTTLARIIAKRTKSEFIPFSAVLAGIKEIKE